MRDKCAADLEDFVGADLQFTDYIREQTRVWANNSNTINSCEFIYVIHSFLICFSLSSAEIVNKCFCNWF